MNTLLLNKKFTKETFCADNLFILCLTLFPILTLVLKKWISVCLFIALGISLYILVINKKKQINFFSDQVSGVWLVAFIVSMAAPLAAIFLGQTFRQEFVWSSFDSASRFFFAIPIALVIIQKRINAFKLIEYAIPTAILVTALSVLINPDLKWGVDRVTTHFVDPLSFGSICLTLALISLVSIDLYKSDMLSARLYKLSGFAIGLYMSFISGSRTGWMAIPIVLWLWLRFKKNIPHWIIFILVTLFCAGVYFFVPMVRIRVDIGMSELLNYQWNNLNPDESIGMRISFVRIGLFLLGHNPLAGWGDSGFRHLLNAPELQRFATDFTRDFTFQAGFHNEIVTNMVRSGIWGLFSSLALFVVPMALFVKGLRSQSVLIRNHALIAVSYFICVVISGMSTEVFNLKFTATFHSLMIVSLAGSLLVLMSSDQTPKSL